MTAADQQQQQDQQPAFDSKGFFGTLSAENQQFAAGKGWTADKFDANAPFDSYRNLEKLVGTDVIPAPRLDDEKALNEWPGFKKLGVPEAADKYELKRPKMPDGMKYDEDGEKVLRQAMFDGKVPAKFAQRIYDHVTGLQLQRETAFRQQGVENAKAAEAELRKTFGAKYDESIAQAQHAYKTLAEEAGVDATLLSENLGIAMGDAGAVKFFAHLGAKMGEGAMKGGGGGGGGAINTPVGAKAEIARLNTDKDFSDAYHTRGHAGHAAAVKRMEDLHKIAFPDGSD